MSDFRLERDSVGEKQVPIDALYGVQTLRGAENFTITGSRIDPVFIDSLAYIKKAAAITNCDAGLMSKEISGAICKACDEILAGQHRDAFITDTIQGGAGTSYNMNINEVVANRATQILGGKLGSYNPVHPNNHVNFGQSTNDVIPTAGKITALKLIDRLLPELRRLISELDKKSREFDNVIKMGRTQMQDAVPVRLGQEFASYAESIERGTKRLENTKSELLHINMGGTAIGTGLNADKYYLDNITGNINKIAGTNLIRAENLIDGTQHTDCFVAVSGALKTLSVALSKMAKDLILMSSGPRTGFGEINLPARQNGSSIMPGKVNPVIPEVVIQTGFLVAGNDVTISMAAESGQLELNAFEPVTFYCLFQSIRSLTGAVNTLTDHCITGITANVERCRQLMESSVGMTTALCPHIGYQAAADIAKKSLATGISVRKLVLEAGLLTEEQLDEILDPMKMTEPGIPGEELLK